MVINKSKNSKKGQIHTLEAVAAAVLILTGVLFAQSVTTVTPMTASTASQHSENQQGEIVKGFTTTVNQNDTLKDTILYWNNSDEEYHNTSNDVIYYIVDTPESEFGQKAAENFIDRGLGLRVDLIYYQEDNDGNLELETTPYMDYGTPSNHAYTTTTTVPLYDSDVLINQDRSESSTQLSDGSSTFYMEDIDPDSNLYNVVKVKITIWRI